MVLHGMDGMDGRRFERGVQIPDNTIGCAQSGVVSPLTTTAPSNHHLQKGKEDMMS